MKILQNIFFSLLIFLIFGEIAARLVTPMVIKKVPPFDTAIKDDKLGWLPKENYTFSGTLLDENRTPYPVHLTSSKHGFRAWPTANVDTLPRIFFLGDSYTQAVEVSDNQTFFHHLGQDIPSQIYAFGMAGYGTFQEYQILERHLDEIKPDLIVLQLCSNDFIDNHEDLERNSNYYVGLRRPYLTADGSIFYATPASSLDIVLSYSAFYRLLKHYWIRNMGRISNQEESSEYLMSTKGLQYPPFAESAKRTNEAIKMIKNKAKGIPILAFCSDNAEPHHNRLWELCTRNNIRFADQVNHRINEARDTSRIFALDGYHWNETGHKAVAKALEKPILSLLK